MRLGRLARLVPAVALAVALGVAVMAGAGDRGGRPTAEQRVARIAREVRCPTCQGLSVQDSDAAASKAIRDVVREQVEAGRSDGEIRAYLVDRYGKDILLKPEASGVGALVWGLPVAAGVAGLAGLVFAFARGRRPRAGAMTDEDRALVAAARTGDDEELAFLLRSLEDLEREREAGDLDDADYAELRDGYTARAAARLRGGPAGGAPQARRPGWVKPVAVTAGVVALAAGSGLLVARSAGERLPDEPATGSIAATGASGRLAQARALVGDRKILEAIKVYDGILAEDPDNVEALAYRGWLARLVGNQAGDPALVDKGLELINRAVAVDPNFPDARFFKGEILLRDKRDAAGAIAEFRAFLASDAPPDMVALVQGELRAAMEMAGQAGQ